MKIISTNEISDTLLLEVNKYYPTIQTYEDLVDKAGEKGYIMRGELSKWRAYDEDHTFIGAADLSGDAWAKVLLYSVDKNQDLKAEL